MAKEASLIESTWKQVRSLAQVAKYRLDRDYLQNPAARRRFHLEKPELSEIQQGILDELRREGITTISLRDFYGGELPAVADEVVATARKFAESDVIKEANEQVAAGSRKDAKKAFIVKMHDDYAVREPSDPVMRFGLQPEILDIANSYLDLYSRNAGSNILYTVPVGKDWRRTQSQNWHRDWDDAPLLKLFLFVNEVTAEAGPFEYAKGTRKGEKYESIWPVRGGVLGVGHYPPSEEVDRVIPSENIVTCTVPELTMAFCDTSGLHRGGMALSQYRLLGFWSWVSPASYKKPLFKVTDQSWIDSLAPAAQAALERD